MLRWNIHCSQGSWLQYVKVFNCVKNIPTAWPWGSRTPPFCSVLLCLAINNFSVLVGVVKLSANNSADKRKRPFFSKAVFTKAVLTVVATRKHTGKKHEQALPVTTFSFFNFWFWSAVIKLFSFHRSSQDNWGKGEQRHLYGCNDVDLGYNVKMMPLLT